MWHATHHSTAAPHCPLCHRPQRKRRAPTPRQPRLWTDDPRLTRCDDGLPQMTKWMTTSLREACMLGCHRPWGEAATRVTPHHGARRVRRRRCRWTRPRRCFGCGVACTTHECAHASRRSAASKRPAVSPTNKRRHANKKKCGRGEQWWKRPAPRSP